MTSPSQSASWSIKSFVSNHLDVMLNLLTNSNDGMTLKSRVCLGIAYTILRFGRSRGRLYLQFIKDELQQGQNLTPS